MADFSKIIELIKASDARTSGFTNEIKLMELELKSIESERHELVNKQKQLSHELSFKQKVIDNKNCEKSICLGQYQIWKTMLKEAETRYEEEEKNLDQIQQSLWELRRRFNHDVNNFLSKNEFLVFNRQQILEAGKKKEVELKLMHEIKILQHEIASLDIEFCNLKSQQDLIDHLKINKQILESEPDVGMEYRRLKNRIDNCLKQLNNFDGIKNSTVQFSKTITETSVFKYDVNFDQGEHFNCKTPKENSVGSTLAHSNTIKSEKINSSFKKSAGRTKEMKLRNKKFVIKCPSTIVQRNE